MARLPASLADRPVAAVLLAFGVGVAGFALVVPVALVLGLALGVLAIELTPVVTVVVGLLSLQGIAFPLAAFLYLRLRGKSFDYVRARLPSLPDIGWSAAGFLAAFLLALVLLVVIQLTDAPTATRSDAEMLQNPEVLLALIPLAFLLIGPGEELLFRGVIQSTLREAFSAPVAVVLASLTFAPAHIVSLVGSPQALLVSISVLFFPSLVFGAVYERTENLLVPALAHGAYDALLFGIVYIGVAYAPETSGLL